MVIKKKKETPAEVFSRYCRTDVVHGNVRTGEPRLNAKIRMALILWLGICAIPFALMCATYEHHGSWAWWWMVIPVVAFWVGRKLLRLLNERIHYQTLQRIKGRDDWG